MKMQCTLPDHAAVVEALLEGFVRACQVCIAAGLAPSDPRDSDVRYQLEPQGEEDWKLPQNCVRDGWGDCEDLAGWRAAGMRYRGEDPEARVVVVRTGPGKLHAVVQRGDGSQDDPSKELYMRQRQALGDSGKRAGGGANMIDHRSKQNQPDSNLITRSIAMHKSTASQDRLNAQTSGPTRDPSQEGERAYEMYLDKSRTGKGPSTSKGQSYIDTSDPQAAADQGFKVDPNTGAASRMTADEQTANQNGAFDPNTGTYAPGYDPANPGAWDPNAQYDQYGNQIDPYGYSYGGGYGYDDGGGWVDPRAAAAFADVSDDDGGLDEDMYA